MGLRLVRGCQPAVNLVHLIIRRLRPLDLGMAAALAGLRMLDFDLQLRHFQRGDDLPFLDAVARIHREGGQVTGDLRVQLHFLERPELGIERNVL